MITGCSTHNQRIERLWRDIHRCVTRLFYQLFYHLESQGLLDPLNEVHLYVLHYVYLPRINHALDEFQRGWNHHSIRTEGNHSPHQLFVHGSLSLQRSGLTALDFSEQVSDDYGVDEQGIPMASSTVNVRESQFALLDEHYDFLRQQVNPMASSENYGIDLYQRALHIIADLVSQNRSSYNM